MTEFAVERLNWQRVYGAIVRRPGTSAVAVCANAASARALAARHETAARRAVNPFAGYDPAYFGPDLGRRRHPDATHLPEAELVEGLRGLGVEPPAGDGGGRDWAGWYAAAVPRWSSERLAAVYGLLTKLRFYRVVERPAAPRPTPPRTAEFVRWQGEAGHDTPFDRGQRSVPGFEFYEVPPRPPRYPRETEPGAVRARHAVPFEVHEVPCEPGVDPDSAAGLVLATRTGFTMPVGTCPELVADPLVPARLFADTSAAGAWCDAREAEDRREFPFAWYGEVPDSLYNPHWFAEVRGAVEALLDLWALPPVACAPDKSYLFDLDLRQWWHDHGHRVTPEQNAAAWAECWGAAWRFVSVRHVQLVG